MATRSNPVTALREASPVVRLLSLTQLAFNVGFFMVLPYLSVHLTEDLGLAAAVVGLVLGLRTFSQQGLFFVGGSLADRWGTKPVVLVGCSVRVLGFVGLATSSSLTTVLVSTVGVGLAAALFSPATEAALSREAGELERTGGPSRVSAFALFSACGQAGTFTGPLVGAVLLLVDFRVSCLVAAAVFVLVLAAHARWLPSTPAAHVGEPLLAGWREVVGNRPFLLFAVAYSGQLVAYNQLYLLLPLEVDRAWGSQSPLALLFAVSSVVAVATQLPVSRRVETVRAGRVMLVGFLLMTTAFVVVALSGPLRLTGVAGLVPAVLFVLLLTAGQVVVGPVARGLVPLFARERRLGAFYGFLSSLGGLCVLLGSSALGLVVQLAPRPGAWALAALVPLASGLALHRLLTASRPGADR